MSGACFLRKCTASSAYSWWSVSRMVCSPGCFIGVSITNAVRCSCIVCAVAFCQVWVCLSLRVCCWCGNRYAFRRPDFILVLVFVYAYCEFLSRSSVCISRGVISPCGLAPCNLPSYHRDIIKKKRRDYFWPLGGGPLNYYLPGLNTPRCV